MPAQDGNLLSSDGREAQAEITGELPSENPASAQDAVEGPLLGFVFDRTRNEFRRIIGIPGSSLFGEPLQFAAPLSNAWISPRQDYALAEQEDGKIVLLDLRTVPTVTYPWGLLPGKDKQVALSTNGSSAVLYDPHRLSIQIVRGLPESPLVVGEWSVSGISGEVASLAVDDLGQIVLLGCGLGNVGTAYQISSEQQLRMVYRGGKISDISFLPQSQTAILADYTHNEIVMLQNLGEDPIVSNLPELRVWIYSPIAVSASIDGQRLFVANAGNNSITVFDLSSRETAQLACSIVPKGLFRLAGGNTFRLNEAAGEPLYMVQSDSSESRVLFVPMELEKPADFHPETKKRRP